MDTAPPQSAVIKSLQEESRKLRQDVDALLTCVRFLVATLPQENAKLYKETVIELIGKLSASELAAYSVEETDRLKELSGIKPDRMTAFVNALLKP